MNDRPYEDKDLIKYLLEELKKGELPGEEAHAQMGSYSRPPAYKVARERDDYKLSAVLIGLYRSSNGELHTILIERPPYEGVHGSQIAFPGGKVEEEDGSTVETALREAEEEVGLKRESVEILGKISDIYIPPSNYMVEPHIGYIEEVPELIRDPAEVHRILQVPLSAFLDKKNIRTKKVKAGMNKLTLKVPAFEIQGYTIWGATAMILSELREILERR